MSHLILNKEVDFLDDLILAYVSKRDSSSVRVSEQTDWVKKVKVKWPGHYTKSFKEEVISYYKDLSFGTSPLWEDVYEERGYLVLDAPPEPPLISVHDVKDRGGSKSIDPFEIWGEVEERSSVDIYRHIRRKAGEYARECEAKGMLQGALPALPSPTVRSSSGYSNLK